MRNNSTVLVLVIVLLLIPGVLAEYSIDISGLEESYSVGEEISYTVILLEDGNVIQRDLEVTFFDDLGKKSIVQQVV